jgi:hypothetical protein
VNEVNPAPINVSFEVVDPPGSSGFELLTLKWNTKPVVDGPDEFDEDEKWKVAVREVIDVTPTLAKVMLTSGPPGFIGGIGPITDLTWTSCVWLKVTDAPGAITAK